MIALRFHRSLYAHAGIVSAASAYADFAKFELAEDDDGSTVSISEIDADFADFPDEFADAFSNHALFEAIRLHRAGSTA